MASSRILAVGAAMAFGWLIAAPAAAQRIQFPTTVRGQLVQAPATATPAPTLNGAPSYGSPPATYQGGAPAYTAPPATTYAPAPAAGPVYSAPPATFQGTVTPAPAWDPYVDPSTVPGGTPYYQPQQGIAPSPPALFPSDGAPSIFSNGGYNYTRPDGTVGAWPRLFQEIRGEYTWLAPFDKPRSLGVNSIAASATMNFPFFYDQAPLLITPGGAIHWLDGPESFGAEPADLPSRVYDLYLDAAWKPVFTPWLSADIGVRVGVYTDFEHVHTDSIRIMGRGLGILTFSPTLRLALGAVYLDRVDVKFLPAGGVIWTPNEDTRYDILFPNPKLSHRLTTLGTTEWWWYIAGEYGMGSWTVDRSDGAGDQVDINDLRVIAGLEWFALSGRRGIFEVGYVFNRELVYASDSPHKFGLDDTVMLRAGLAY